MRWWDGRAWGPYAPQGDGRDSNDKTLATLSHLGVVLGGFILPLIMYIVSNDQNRPETRWHAREALNFQLSFILAYFGSFALMFAGFGAVGLLSAGSNPGAAFGAGFAGILVLLVVAFGLIVTNIVCSIIGALRANSGVRWRYPVSFRFVKEPAR